MPAFTPGGTAQIKGKVTNAAATKTIEGIEVCASGDETFECVTSGTNGEYDITGLAAGEYRVSFAVPYESELNYLLQYYNGKPTYEEATPVVLASGGTASSINAAMAEGGQITGKVTDAKTKAGIEACAYSTTSGEYVERCAKTKAGGAYDIVALSTAGYKVEFYRPYTSSLNYLLQYYNGKGTYEEANVVPVTVGATTNEINAALHEGAEIEGKVTDASTKAAIAKILVCADGECAETNASGEYTIGGLLGGEYRVEFQPAYESGLNYLRQYYNDTTNYNEATLVSTAIGAAATGINAALQLGGELGGTVKSAASKEGVEDVEVCASEDSGEYVDRCAETNTKGEYTVVAIPTGDYIVEFYPSGPYAPQYYNAKVSFEEATAVPITAGTLTPNINASLQPGGEITGKVTNAKTKAAVADVEVCPELVDAEASVSCTETDENGEYAITKLPAAEYRVEFTPPYEANYLLQYYNGKSTAEEANTVTLATRGMATGINAALHEGGTINGVVTNAATKADVDDIEVCAESTTGDEFLERCAYSDEAGKYSIVGLPTGSYRVWFSSPSDAYAEQYYNDKTFSGEAELVSVTAGTPTTGINAAMQPVASIRGVVTSKATKAPAVDVEVCVLEASNGEYVQCTSTGGGGEYAFTTLGAGEYKIEFGVNGNANYTPQYYNDKATLAEANIITLATGEEKPAINAALQEGGEISGTVVDATTTKPVEGIEVCGYKNTGEYIDHCAETNASGEYSVVGLPLGDYVVEFYPNGRNYLTQYYNDKANYDEATAVPVSLGETTPEIDASLKPGAEITGVVKTGGTGGAVIADADVCAEPRVSGTGGCGFTNASGEYTIVGLTTGEYTVEFTGDGQNYVAQYYNDKAKASEATAVSAIQGSTTPNINASLEVGGEITGIVETAKTKEPIDDVSVDAYETNGTYVTSGYTNTKGEYTVEGLATGEYKLEFYSNTEEYKTQYYKAKESLGEATSVAVTSDGHITPGINAALVLAPPVLVSAPTIMGKDQEDHTLTEGHGTWKNSPTEYTYQWVLCNEYGYGCTDIEHATKQTYELVFEDVGHTLRVEETAHNETGASSPASSVQTEVIAVAPPENTKLPKITGTAQQGKELKEVAGTWTNEPTKAKLQWLRCNASGGECGEIADATSSSYTLVAENVGHTLRVRETAENGAGPSSPASSEPTAEVVPPAPVNTALPKISGTAQQGQELKEQQGAWEYSPTERKYQWLQCNALGEGCLAIGGATEQKYIARPEDVGDTLRVEEYAKNAGGIGGPAVSTQTAEVLPAPPVDVTPPTIEGTAQQGETLTEHHGSWENNPTKYKYEWLLCNAGGGECAAIKGAKEEPYAVGEAEVGHTIRVAETAENCGGKSAAAADSEPTAVVVPPAPVLKSAPTITGTAKQGKELTLHHGAWEYSPTSYEDTWLRCNPKGESCENTGETGQTYELATADVGHELRVEEVAINEGGHSTPATSAPTGVVANAAPEDETPPTIEGTVEEGKELTLQHGKWTNEPISYEDQWLRCNEHGEECHAITSADETKYTPVKEDVGHEIRVEEKAHNEGGTSSPTDSAPSAVVLPAAPVDVKPPTITGEAVQGKALTEHHGTWENSPTGYTLHWLECNVAGEGCLPISGAEGETYKPTALDVGHTIRVEEVAYNAGGEGDAATSAPTEVVTSAAPANVTAPSVGGTPETGQTLVDQHGAWTNEPTSYRYRWLRCTDEGSECKPIAGAVDPTYALTAADVGATFQIQEVAINVGGASEPATSTPTAVVRPVPLHAVAGESVNATAGVAVNFDGSGSTPASEIEKYTWEFGDGGQADGASVTHAYASEGTYTATLTITRDDETSTAPETVTVAPAPTHAATVEVTDSSHNPLSRATVLYIGPRDERIQAVTGSDGKASLALPDGTDTVYAYSSGYQPAVGQVTMNDNEGETTIALSSGEIAISTLKSHEMTLKEIEAAGINTSDPENQNVYEFEVRLAFIESPVEPIQFHCYINSKGEFVGPCGGGCGCGGGGGWGGWGGWGGGGGGGGGASGPSCSPHECVGGGIVAVPEVVEGRPLIQWLVLRGKASVLKQFFEVTQVVQNLSPEPFTLVQGSATLHVPPGMSLAPTATPQTAIQTVPEIPGGGSAETNWIVRGDAPGEYLLSANYESQLEPFGAEAPVDIEARLASPLKVWGVEALELHVEAEEGFLAEGQPYHVHVSVRNKADIPLNNVDVEIFSSVHERFIFQPDQQFSETIAELKPGEKIAAPEDILVPDDASEAEFNPALSSVHFVGEEIHPGVGIETLPNQPVYSLAVNDESASKRVHIDWQPDPNAEGYEVFSTPTLDTAFPGTPESVKTDPNGASMTELPKDAVEAYAPFNSDEPSKYWAVASVIHGKLTLDHIVETSSFGSGAEDWGYCINAGGEIALGGVSADGTVCIVRSGDGSHAYLMAHGNAGTLQPPTNTNTFTTDVLNTVNSCAASVSVSVGAIAFEGPEDENPGRTYAAVKGSIGIDVPFTKFGLNAEGALLQSRDLSTFGIYYGAGVSAGYGCLSPAPFSVGVEAEPSYKLDSLELSGADRDAAIALVDSIQQSLSFPSPAALIGEVPKIGKPLINLVKSHFDGLYEGLTGVTATAPTEPTGIEQWALSPSTSSNNESATATTPDQSISASGRGVGVLGVGTYKSAPHGVPALQVGTNYFDAEMSKDSLFDPVTITDCGVSANETPQWLDGSTWQKVSGAVYESQTQCFLITITENTSPNLSQLTGTVFAVAPNASVCTASPAIEEQPTDQTLTAPAEATFNVKEGTVPTNCSPASIQWQLSTDGGASWSAVSGANFEGATSATLKINSTATGESGHQLRAVLSNAHGETDSAAATLTVNEAGSGSSGGSPASGGSGGSVSGGSGGSSSGSSGGTARGGVEAFKASGNMGVTVSGPITTESGAVYVSLHCSATMGQCLPATVQLLVQETLRNGRVTAITAGHKTKAKTRTVVIGSATVTLSAGHSETVKVALNSAGKKLVAEHKHLVARLRVESQGHTLKAQNVTISESGRKGKEK